ncbi:MAG: phosphoglucosamine mutase [Actinobacteria bacterium]|nr:phosphoglucosamine mutase [Actinomycetota bacterium]
MAPKPAVLRFGTDGVRGVADRDLTSDSVRALGRAAARILGPDVCFLIARDTRASGPSIEAALADGFLIESCAVESVGVLPTPGLAYLSQERGLPAAMVSASHNPYEDNGIKLFSPGGRKLPDEVEARIEAEMASLPEAPAALGSPGAVVRAPDAARLRYLEHLVECLDGRSLDGLRAVIDCANGAAFEVAPETLRRLGVEVTVLAAAPDGRNINAGCGSTHPNSLQAAVPASGAHAGLAFDGDADRLIAVDEQGGLVDGDLLLAISALDLKSRGALAHDTVVVTVMANLGFRRAMEQAGIRVVETRVGDRYVLEAMDDGGYSLGGEQSGHVIFADLATTGDGLLSGILLLDVVRRSGRTVSDLASVVTKLPQVLASVRVADRSGLDAADSFWAEVAAVEAELGREGRVLVRPSGTEPLVRVMVEAPTDADAARHTARLSGALVSALGDPS